MLCVGRCGRFCGVAWHAEQACAAAVSKSPPTLPSPPEHHRHHLPTTTIVFTYCSLDHLPSGLEPSARFLDRVALHYARNALAGRGALPGQVPLVLGIWGPKVRGATCLGGLES